MKNSMGIVRKSKWWSAIAGTILLGIAIMAGGMFASGTRAFAAGDSGAEPVSAVQDLPAGAEITSLDIELTQNALEIKQGDAFSLEISEKMKPYAQYSVKDGTLFFKDTRELVAANQNYTLGTRNELRKYRAVITLPKDQELTGIQISAGVSEVSISGVRMVKMDYYGGVGVLDARDIAVSERFLLECGVGECDIRGDLRGELDIRGGVGDVSVTLDGPRSDYAIEATTGVGTLEIGGQSHGMLARKITENTSAPNSVEITSGVGKISIAFGG